ncbi:prolyl oligopeptidase family serine peptidase [Pedobacter sp. HMF7647]|uniref:Prolyl oligopeptidase family serine peptidase n=1 Tax=Hufsiella arboris TaxID=2695275 RepID=A0A7K1YCJ4_9SPHI|nr:alpha/beta hydrolase [Hufsiella arboris]MXV52306.1 prolyl oligopeptidase family serine peptidase [Hufsiella arboris]
MFFAKISTAQNIIPLYKNVPNSVAVENLEKTETAADGITRASKVSVPTLSVYQPEKGKANGTAVIICPGGGYAILSIVKEGYDIAKEFNKRGITAFVLKYRLPSDVTMKDKSIGPLQDAQQAIKLVRERAGEWNVDPAKIGIMGFSAGGHLASTAATHYNKAVIENSNNTSVRPDFQILMYPVISFTDSIAHKGSRENLLGKSAPAEQVKLYSNEEQITSTTPPAFLIHCEDDNVVPVLNTIWYYEALIKNKIPSEMHIYPKGGHGFGLNNKSTSDQWFDRCINWMQSSGLLNKTN